MNFGQSDKVVGWLLSLYLWIETLEEGTLQGTLWEVCTDVKEQREKANKFFPWSNIRWVSATPSEEEMEFRNDCDQPVREQLLSTVDTEWPPLYLRALVCFHEVLLRLSGAGGAAQTCPVKRCCGFESSLTLEFSSQQKIAIAPYNLSNSHLRLKWLKKKSSEGNLS